MKISINELKRFVNSKNIKNYVRLSKRIFKRKLAGWKRGKENGFLVQNTIFNGWSLILLKLILKVYFLHFIFSLIFHRLRIQDSLRHPDMALDFELCLAVKTKNIFFQHLIKFKNVYFSQFIFMLRNLRNNCSTALFKSLMVHESRTIKKCILQSHSNNSPERDKKDLVTLRTTWSKKPCKRNRLFDYFGF